MCLVTKCMKAASDCDDAHKAVYKMIKAGHAPILALLMCA